MKHILASAALILSFSLAQAQQTTPTPPVPPASSAALKPPANLTCTGDRVVWVNTATKVYHPESDRYFGKTKAGKFTCEKTAVAEGDHAAKR